jgi:pimeloyl-ACP methyl ester carboxylesterase
MASLADEVVERYDGPLDLVGVSLGGMVAQRAAIRHPERVRSVLAACTIPAGDPDVMGERARGAREDMPGSIETALTRWFTPDFLAQADHPVVAYSRRTLERLDPEAYAQAWEAIAAHDATAELGSVRAFTTVLAGRDDVSAPPEKGEAIAAAVPGARLVVLAGPHMLFMQDGPAFAAEVRDHLARVNT